MTAPQEQPNSRSNGVAAFFGGDIISGYLAKVVMLAAVYFATGYLSLLLAIPPDFNIVLWAPAGFALAGLLRCGNRVWPGVFLGAFCVTLFISLENASDSLSLTAVLFAGVHATGATLQAVIGAVSVKRFVSFPTPLERTRDTILLVVLGGPVACLVNSINGAVALQLFGFAAGDQFLTNWFTWWVGDTVGVVAFTPVLILLFTHAGQVSRRRKQVVASGLVILFVVAGMTFFGVKERDKGQKLLEFQKQSQEIANQFQRDAELYISILISTEQFLRSSGDVSFSQFSTFTESYFTRYPGIHALSWNPRITHAERDVFEKNIRRQGYPDFYIKELTQGSAMRRAAAHPVYVPVAYIVPYAANSVAHGFNTYDVNKVSGDQRRRALDLARDTGSAMTTVRISVVQASNQYGLLVFHPAYTDALNSKDTASRRQHLAGYTVGVFLISQMVSATQSAATRRKMDFTLRDLEAPADRQFLYDSKTSDHKENISSQPGNSSSLQSTATLGFAGRTFQMSLFPGEGYFADNNSWYLWAVLVGALVFTGLVSMILLMVTAQTAVVERAVTEKAADLKKAEMQLRQHAQELTVTNEQLESFSYMASHDLQEPVRKMVSFSQFLEKDLGPDLPARARDDLDQIVDAAKRMQILILDLLDLSRAGAGDIDLQPIPVSRCVKSVLEMLEIQINESGASIDQDDLPVVTADATLVSQVYQNLITNALKFTTPERAPHIRLTAEHQEDQLVLGVSDNGIGIDQSYTEQIFAPFKRLHGRGTYSGTGIGLAICRKAVERHGGRIWVEPTAGGGSHFRFTLKQAA